VNYLQGRFLPPEPSIRGMFIGHTWAHTRFHFYRAILESIAYDHFLTRRIIQELVPDMRFPVITAIGSGSQSDLWMKIKADVLQVNYVRLMRSDLATLGAAIVAGCGIGLFNDVTTIINRFAAVKAAIEPDNAEGKRYAKYVEIYENLFPALKETYKKLAGEN
jgi:xylulokinase